MAITATSKSAEDVFLCRAWRRVTENAQAGNDQKADAFREIVAEDYASLVEETSYKP